MRTSRNAWWLLVLVVSGSVMAAARPSIQASDRVGSAKDSLKSGALPQFLKKHKSSSHQPSGATNSLFAQSDLAGPAAEEDDVEDSHWYKQPRPKKEAVKPVASQKVDDMEDDEEEVATEPQDEAIAPPRHRWRHQTVLVMVNRIRKNGQIGQTLVEFPYEAALQLMQQHEEEYLRRKR